MQSNSQQGKRLSDESVKKGTGYEWAHWFGLLDNWDAKSKPHKEIAAWLLREQSLSPWWSQTVAIHYEWARGLRVDRQGSKGFSTTVTRTIYAPLERAWEAWADPVILSQWFTTGAEQNFVVGGRYSNNDGDSGVFKCITPLKHIRFTWEQKQHQPGSDVVLEFEDKGDRVRVSLTHEKLRSKEDADDLKEGWSWAMDCLKMFLETGRKIGFDEWKAGKA